MGVRVESLRGAVISLSMASLFAAGFGVSSFLLDISSASGAQSVPVPSSETSAVLSADTVAGSSARSVAAALVADFQAGKTSNICSLAPPSVRSRCKSEVKGELDGTHPSFPHVRLSSVRVTGNNATYTLSCSGAQYCGNFTGRNVSQAIVKQNGKWYLVYNSTNFREFRTLSQLRLW